MCALCGASVCHDRNRIGVQFSINLEFVIDAARERQRGSFSLNIGYLVDAIYTWKRDTCAQCERIEEREHTKMEM